MKAKTKTDNKNGFLLIIIVSLLGLLAFLGIAFTQSSYYHQKFSKHFIDTIRSNFLAWEGVELVKHEYLSRSLNNFNLSKQITINEKQHSFAGLIDIKHHKEANAKININDGIEAGKLEITNPNDPYLPHSCDPWEKWEKIRFRLPNITEVERASAMINLRLRRLLNAYGDVHRFIDIVYDDDHKNINNPDYYKKTLPNPVIFSSHVLLSADGRRNRDNDDEYHKFSMKSNQRVDDPLWYNNALGDRIIEARPIGGYKTIDEIESIVNEWAISPYIDLSEEYLNNLTFYEFITNDLTVSSYEDIHFSRLRDEFDFGDFDATEYTVTNKRNRGNFYPIDLATNPPYLRPFGLWAKHSVALINLNSASFAVKAAIFYAPTNVSLVYQSATTLLPYNGQRDWFGQHTSKQAMIPCPSIGTGPPIFQKRLRLLENGHAQAGRSSHLMSMRDAFYLAHHYENYIDEKNHLDQEQTSGPKPILNFDDFRDFLLWHETENYMDHNIYGIIPPYEKAVFPGHHNTREKGIDFDAGNSFHISQFDDYGAFAQDYTRKILPHILSCVRRIPNYLGAPAALISPYMIIKPDKERSDYVNDKKLCQQAMIYIDDFVWRSMHPKVCFSPCGDLSLTSTAHVIGPNNVIRSSTQINADFQLFKTKYYRSQQDFINITDSNFTHQDIKIGPEVGTPDPDDQFDPKHIIEHLGFVGLNDYDQDIEDGDPLVGYNPQIVMNFNPIDNNSGYENTSPFQDKPKTYVTQDCTFDLWLDALGSDGNTLNDSIMEGSQYGHFADPKERTSREKTNDLSPFNGVFFSSMGHGEFTTEKFSDSLYWRLDDWLSEGAPIGQNTSIGTMTFWFRMPSDYDYVHNVDSFTGECFSRVFVSLNFWEKYIDSTEPLGIEVDRAVAITVGLKKTIKKGLNVFVRYDSGAEPYTNSFDLGSSIYIGTDPFSPLIPSLTQPLAMPQYDFAGFRCHSIEHPLLDIDDYFTFRAQAHRSSEVNASFKNIAEAGPGTWHRVNVGWNFRWQGENSNLASSDQLWLRLNNNTTKLIEEEQDPYVNEYHEEVSLPVNPAGHPQYYLYPGQDPDLGGGAGMMLPYNSSMVLSLGESHARRLVNNSLFVNGSEKRSYAGKYYPYWRLNSCIDNFRFYMGPSDPNQYSQEHYEYFKSNGTPYNQQNAANNIYEAMRYNITTAKDHGVANDNEPTWVIDFKIQNQSRLISLGTRVYYPPDSNDNFPYVQFSAWKNSEERLSQLSSISLNEQDLFFSAVPTTSSFRAHLQYKAHKPLLNGNQDKIGEPLRYTGLAGSNDLTDDHFTNLPWIKEVSIRYIPPQGTNPTYLKID